MIHFLGIGAQKAGTTWLYEQLQKHPEIAFPAGKELHFWSRFPLAEPADYLASFPDCPPGMHQGEITPAYALLERDTIRRVHAANPRLRILYCLRNPIERAWSSALMALQRAEMEPDEASDQWFIDHFRSAGSLGRGDYLQAVRRWRAVFGNEAVLLLRFDDLVERPQILLDKCARHIGVMPEWFRDCPEASLREPVFPGLNLPLRPTLRCELETLYSGRIAALQHGLDIDLSAWLNR